MLREVREALIVILKLAIIDTLNTFMESKQTTQNTTNTETVAPTQQDRKVTDNYKARDGE